MGFDALWRHYYSSVPTSSDIERAHAGVHEMPNGIRWHGEAQRHLLQDLMPHRGEFRALVASKSAAPYVPFNGGYDLCDGETMYAMALARQPARIVEVGCGWSTLCIAAAVRRLRADGHPCEFVAVDPYPHPVLDPLPDGVTRLLAEDVRDAVPDIFDSLRAGDILSIDTTHVVKVGGEVNYLHLEILPRVAAGVAVHVHDIFLPRPYPRRWAEENGYFWGEQYVLQALLTDSARYDIILAANWLFHEGAYGSAAAAEPSGFWFETQTSEG